MTKAEFRTVVILAIVDAVSLAWMFSALADCF